MQGIWFDLKRIFDDKKLFVIVLVSPVLIMILFTSFIIPMLFTSKQIGFNIALFNEDKSPEIDMYLSHILKAKSLSDVVHVYPVNQYEKGIELVKEDKVSAFVHIPQDVYQTLEKGEDVSYEIVGLKHHLFEVQLLKMTFDSSFGHVGRGQNVLNLAHDIVLEYDISTYKVEDFEESLTQSAINGYMNRRKTLGEDGIISPLFEQFAFEYYLSAIFAMFSFLSIVLCINFTSADFNKFIFKRQVLQGIPTSYLYMRRLLSSAIFILIASLSILPTFLVLQRIDPNLVGYHQQNFLALLSGLGLVSLMYSSISMLIATLFYKKTHVSLISFVFILIISLLSGAIYPVQALPKALNTLMQVLPLRLNMKVISLSLFSFKRQSFLLITFYIMGLVVIINTIAYILFKREG